MKKRDRKCLVTGATGYLGTVLVKLLFEAGDSVTSLALPGDDVGFVAQFSDVRYADVCDKAALEREAVGFDVVVHLAGIIDIGSRNRALIRRVNVGGTVNVAEVCRKHHMRMIYCSSVHAFPCPPKNETISEIRDFTPDTVKGLYSKTKAEATRRVLEMTAHGLDAMIAFPSGIIGPHERRLTNIGQLIVDFLCGGLKAYIDGWYNFVDVRDVAEGICGMLDHWKTGECYILSGQEVSVENMLFEIAKASDQRMLRVKLPYWFALGTSYFAEFYYFLLRKKPLFTHYSLQTLHSNCRFSNKKARDELGYHARPLSESLIDMTRWMMEHFVVGAGGKYRPSLFRDPKA